MDPIKTPFNMRLREDLMADLRSVSIQHNISMTTLIEDALDRYLPALKASKAGA
jgi:predicted HicB family RNase H-like nuclease